MSRPPGAGAPGDPQDPHGDPDRPPGDEPGAPGGGPGSSGAPAPGPAGEAGEPGAAWPELGAELREVPRQEREETERWALQRMLQERSLPDVVYELMSRGDELGVRVAGGRSFVGQVVHGAGDLVRIRTPHHLVDVNLAAPLTAWVVRRPRARGVERGPGVLSFRARLKELERAGAAERLRLLQQLKRLGSARVANLPVPERAPSVVELGLVTQAQPLLGQVEAVAHDHVYFIDQSKTEWFIPLGTVSYVAERR